MLRSRHVHLLWIYATVYTVFAQNNTCTTPKHQTGQCIPLKQCPSLLDLLTTKPVTNTEISILQKHHCGFESPKVPKVCCPISTFPSNNNNWTSPPDKHNLLDKKSCGRFSESRIIFGNFTEIGEYPWVALLKYETSIGNGFQCSGVLISKRFVLTAAHCVTGTNKKLLSVRLGEHNLDTAIDCEVIETDQYCADPPIDVPIERTVVHKDYKPNDANKYNDLALIRLQRNVEFNDYVQPICLPTSSDVLGDINEGFFVRVTDWGSNGMKSGKKWVQNIKIDAHTMNNCTAEHENVVKIDGNKQICIIDGKGRVPCNGNSGGPLVTSRESRSYYELLGIQSFESSCTKSVRSSVYTMINYDYMKWILSNMDP